MSKNYEADKRFLVSWKKQSATPGCHNVWLCFPGLSLEVLFITVSFTFDFISQHSVCHCHSSVHCTQLFPVMIVPSCSLLVLLDLCIYSLPVSVCVQSRCIWSPHFGGLWCIKNCILIIWKTIWLPLWQLKLITLPVWLVLVKKTQEPSSLF